MKPSLLQIFKKSHAHRAKKMEVGLFITRSNVKVTIYFKGGITGATFSSFKDLNSNEHFLNAVILKKLLKREQLTGHIRTFLQCPSFV